MKFPLSWLQEYIDPGLTDTQIGNVLTSIGLEVDGIENVSTNNPGGSSTDTIFEVSLTPNLGHAASIIGTAKELSAATGRPVAAPKISVTESSEPIDGSAKVTIEDKKGCPRYACRIIKGVTIKPSPEWLQNRLLACGLRPINNIVDITNYVLMEMGQPLHAFDYDCLDGHAIIVRQAENGETFVTLDEKPHLLQTGDLLICDARKPVALAGIMGGLNSEVSNKTVNVLLEAAYFHPATIRKTSKRLNIQTDASKRFERGCDPNATLKALDKAAMLMHEIAGGRVLKGTIDIKDAPFTEKTLQCRLSRINQILGTTLSISEVETIFNRLLFQTKWDGKDSFSVTVPTYRVDISAEIDLIEEIGRIYGYDNILKVANPYRSSAIPHSSLFLFEREMRSRMISEGLQEFMTCDLIGPTISNIVKEHLMPDEAIIKVLNPTSIEQSILRTSLLPGFMQLVKYNLDHQNHDIKGFEIGRIHFKEKEQYKEESVVGVILSGKSFPHHWDKKPHELDFFDLKGILDNLLQELGITKAVYKSSEYKAFHPGRQASIYVDALELGSMGEIHPAIIRRLDASQRIFFAELSLHALMQVKTSLAKMQPLPLYPSSERDWTVTLREQIPLQKILSIVHSHATPLLEGVSCIDIYRSEKLGSDRKNVTFRFVYRDKEKTIEQEAVDAEHQKIISATAKALELIDKV